MDSTKRSKRRIAFPTLNGHDFFEIDSIIYIKAANSQCSLFIVGKAGAIVVNKSLKECEEELEDDDFVRIHKSYLINYNHLIKYIKGKGGIAIMSNKDELNVSNDKKENLLKKMRWKGEKVSCSHAISSDSQPNPVVSQVGA